MTPRERIVPTIRLREPLDPSQLHGENNIVANLRGEFMPRVDLVRAEVQRMLRAAPFHPFSLTLEDRSRVLIEHPENIAFNPGSDQGAGGSEDFYVLSNQL